MVIKTAPSLFVFCFIQIATHLAIILGLGHLFKFSRRDILLASNANVGGTLYVASIISSLNFTEDVAPSPRLFLSVGLEIWIENQW